MQRLEFYQQASHKLNEVGHKIQLIEHEMNYMNEDVQQTVRESLDRIHVWHRQICQMLQEMRQANLKSWFEQMYRMELLWQNIHKEFIRILVNLPDVGAA